MKPYVLFFNALDPIDETPPPDKHLDRWCVGVLGDGQYRHSSCLDCSVKDVRSFDTFEEAVDVLRSKVVPL